MSNLGLILRSLVEANARFVVVGPLIEVDLFVDPPIPFDSLAARATTHELFGQRVLVASLEDLVAMKRLAGRPKDLDDIRALEAIQRGRTS